MKLYSLPVVSPLNLLKSKKVVQHLKKKGKSKDRPDSDYDAEQLKMGIEVEKEHTDSEEAAKEIAKDHLEEIPDYYTRLDKMENAAKKSLPDLEKGKKVPVGTVSGKYKKVAEGKWVRIPKGKQGSDLSPSEKKRASAAMMEGAAEGGAFLARNWAEGQKKKKKRAEGFPVKAHEATVTGITAAIKRAVGYSMPKLRRYQAMQDQMAQNVYENKGFSEDRKAELLDKLQLVRDVYTAAISVKNFGDKAEAWADNIVEHAKQSKAEWEKYKTRKSLDDWPNSLEKGEKEVKEAMKHEDKPGAGAKKRKRLRNKQDKVHAVMKEFKEGTLHSSSGEKVTSRDQAIAIAMSEAGMSKKSVEEYLDVLEKSTDNTDKKSDSDDTDEAPVKSSFRKNDKGDAAEEAKRAKQIRKEAGYDVSAEKSRKVGLVMSKGKKMAVGTVAVWGGQKYQKVSEGMWKPVPVGAPKARISVRRSEYHGKQGYSIVGKDKLGRKVNIFTDDAGKAKMIVTAIKNLSHDKASEDIDRVLLGRSPKYL